MNTERPENETSQPTAPSGGNLAGDTESEDNFTVDDGEYEAPPDELPPVDEVASASVEDTVSAPPVIPEPPPRRGGSAFSFLALLISLVALAGAGWMWWQDQSVDGQQDERVFAEIARLEGNDSELTLKLNRIRDELETLSASDSGAEFEAMQRRLEADRSKLGNLERAITEQLNQSRSLQAAADSMHGRLAAAEAALTG